MLTAKSKTQLTPEPGILNPELQQHSQDALSAWILLHFSLHKLLPLLLRRILSIFGRFFLILVGEHILDLRSRYLTYKWVDIYTSWFRWLSLCLLVYVFLFVSHSVCVCVSCTPFMYVHVLHTCIHTCIHQHKHICVYMCEIRRFVAIASLRLQILQYRDASSRGLEIGASREQASPPNDASARAEGFIAFFSTMATSALPPWTSRLSLLRLSSWSVLRSSGAVLDQRLSAPVSASKPSSRSA